MFLLFAQQPNGHFQSMQVASDNYAATVTAACLLRLEFPVAKKATLHHYSRTAKPLAVNNVK